MARTANVARRIRSSLRVFQAKIPNATNAPIATAKRFKKDPSQKTLGISAAGFGPVCTRNPPHPVGIVLAGIILVVIILVHREGFEPSYLRGGADLQSAGFNHSPTCAELQNSPAIVADIAAYIRFTSQIFASAYGDRSDGFAKIRMLANVKNRNAREYAIARKHHTWKIPLWSAVGKSVKPPRRAQYPASRINAGAGEGI